MIRISEVNLTPDEPERLLKQRCAELLKVDPSVITALKPVRRAVDARRGQVRFSYTVELAMSRGEEKALRTLPKAKKVEVGTETPLCPGNRPILGRPVIAGSGPAGLFAALELAKNGYRPLILERGMPVEKRAAAVEAFFLGAPLDTETNVEFGEGGAGTFSDGKLTTRIRDPRCTEVLEAMAEAGAPEDILYLAKPHVGTDRLQKMVPRIRERIKELGGEFLFNACLTHLERGTEGELKAVRLADGQRIETNALILALGHSARDTLRYLREDGLGMEQKGFAMGVRIEHHQSWLDKARYGAWAGHPRLGAADYSLTETVRGLSVYTFCMCPGGTVVNASSQKKAVCVNGMSDYARHGENCNAAWVCQVTPERFGSEDPLAGVLLQEKLEQAAYRAGEGGAPAQRLEDFLKGRETGGFGEVLPTVRPAAVPADLNRVLPEWMTECLKAALPAMDRHLPGFAHPDAVLTAIEARTSSPVRIPRDENGQAIEFEGVYPAGEGAGYAGGIVSSAVDGLAQARKIIEAFAPPKEGKAWS